CFHDAPHSQLSTLSLHDALPISFVAVSLNDPNPAVLLFELSPTSSPSVTLSTLSLNPTTVTGGDSSTGTVTLSGPAPSGGAQVRSEEHTSELQSLRHLVCRLLLE